MARLIEALISPEQLISSSKNYFRCLNLSPKSQVLIITDKLSNDVTVTPDPNLLIRRIMTDLLGEEIKKEGHRIVRVNFDSKMSKKLLHGETERALKELDELDDGSETNHNTTVIYLGDIWLNRKGIYQASSEFGAKREVNFAGSLGFTTGDCRVMSELDEKKQITIEASNKYFDDFFKKKPNGMFDIVTRDAKEQQHFLYLSYDTSQAPFETDMGRFENDHRVLLEGENFQYVNIPGGEKFGAPFPFNKIDGRFSAEGLIFRVYQGLIIEVEFVGDKPFEEFDPSQRKLIEIIQQGGRMPVAELGLGFYDLAGIKTYSDSSILSREKSGPHIGLGHNVSKNIEAEEVAKLAEEFHHTDFVLSKPTLIWTDLDDQSRQQFYPPPQN